MPRTRSRRRRIGSNPEIRISTPDLRLRLLENLEQREDEEAIKDAMDFFLWSVRPITGFVQRVDDPMLPKIRKLGNFVSIDESPIDMVAEELVQKATTAYQLLLEEEIKGNRKVKEYWGLPIWETYQLKSFRERLGQVRGESIQVVLWVNSTDNKKVLRTIDELDNQFPEFLDI